MSTTRDLALLPEIVTGAAKLAVSAAGGKSGDLWMIPPEHVHIDPLDNVRPLNPDRVEHLAKLIAEHGFDKSQPLGCIVKRIDGKDLVYVYSGQHRYHGAKLAIERGKAILALPCVIRDAKTVSRRSLIVTGVTNNDSERLSPLDLAGAIEALKREGLTQADITQQLHITDQTVRDVTLLASAPIPIRQLVSTGKVSSTLAIEQIREHGADKALQRFEKSIDAAAAKGKTKITKKDLPKTLAIDPSLEPALHSPEITMGGIVHADTVSLSDAGNRRYMAITVEADRRTVDAPAKVTKAKPTSPPDRHVVAAYAALRAVASDRSFRDFPVRIRDQVMSAIGSAPAGHGSEAGISGTGRPLDIANEHGVFDQCEVLEWRAPKGPAFASIHVAHAKPGVWTSSASYSLGDSGGGSMASMLDVTCGYGAFSTRGQAVAEALATLSRRVHRPELKNSQGYKAMHAWINELVLHHDPDTSADLFYEWKQFRQRLDRSQPGEEADKVIAAWIEQRRVQTAGDFS